jgi:hypothetical protein
MSLEDNQSRNILGCEFNRRSLSEASVTLIQEEVIDVILALIFDFDRLLIAFLNKL